MRAAPEIVTVRHAQGVARRLGHKCDVFRRQDMSCAQVPEQYRGTKVFVAYCFECQAWAVQNAVDGAITGPMVEGRCPGYVMPDWLRESLRRNGHPGLAGGAR